MFKDIITANRFPLRNTRNCYRSKTRGVTAGFFYKASITLEGYYILQDYIKAILQKTGSTYMAQKNIMLPTPHFIVFYNGSSDMPDENSDAFVHGENGKNFPEPECHVRILNIINALKFIHFCRETLTESGFA